MTQSLSKGGYLHVYAMGRGVLSTSLLPIHWGKSRWKTTSRGGGVGAPTTPGGGGG